MADTSSQSLPLAADFPPATREQWLRLVEGVLKGRPFEKLISRTYDGLAIEPLYGRAADARPIGWRAPAATWQMLQRIDHPDAATANTQALEDLENGAIGLSLVFGGAIGAHGFGLNAAQDAIARVLDGVHLDAGIALELDLSPLAKGVAEKLSALLKQRGVAPSATDIRFGFDPLGAMALSGDSAVPWKEIAPRFSELIRTLAAEGFKGPFAVADGRVIHAAGGSEAQELAFALAVALAYLRALETEGVALDAARRMIFFRLAADADQLLTIAKLRALRKLWARVEDACGLAPRPAFVSAETAWRMMTRRDPHVNMLRTTVAVFAAAIGGADAITVLPFTAALGLPDTLARRVARNTQLILAEESNLAKVSDPAAGSGALEDLTDQLCHAAWALFQDIERAGGTADALASGLIQKHVGEVRAARERAVAHRVEALTGTSEFPNLAEAPVVVLQEALVLTSPLAGKVGLRSNPGEGAARNGNHPETPPHPDPRIKSGAGPLPASGEREKKALTPMRLAAPFEALRHASDRVLEQTGARPKVFLANLGKPAEFLARATFAKNFFEAGGIEMVSADTLAPSPLPGGEAPSSPLPSGERSAAQRPGEGSLSSPETVPSPHPTPSASTSPRRGEVKQEVANFAALISTFAKSGAKLACICSSDEVYQQEAEATAKALAVAGARHIYLAGRPRDLEDVLKAAGVGGFIYAGCDVVATLQAAYDIIGAE